MNKKTKGLVTVLSVCVVLLIVLSAVLLNVNKKEEPVTDNTVDNNVGEVINEEPVEYTDDYYRDFIKSQKDNN